MAVECLTTITEQWIRDRLQIKHPYLGDVRSLSLPGTYQEKIRCLGYALKNFVRLKSLDLSCNALVSVEGVQHLKMLERLNLYYNCIPSIQEVKVLFKLPALRELDLRLNPLTKSDPHYRLCLVHAMSNLRKLDDCPVRDTERKTAIMHCSSSPVLQQKSPSLNHTNDQRSSDLRLASVDHLTKKLSMLDSSDDIVLNFVAKSNFGQSEPQSLHSSFHKDRESQLYHLQEFEEGELKNVSEPESSSSQKQETAKSILRYPQRKDVTNSRTEMGKKAFMFLAPSPWNSLQKDLKPGHTQSKEPHKKSPTSLKVTEGPRVSFDPHVEKHRPVSTKKKQRDPPNHLRLPAKGHFTPNPDQGLQRSSSLINIRPPSPRSPGLSLSDPSNPILHPPRLSYSSFNKTAEGSSLPQKAQPQKRGSYRKPLEMLLNLVDKHWSGERSLHHNNNFLSQAVQILSMMEDDISGREAEVMTLRREVEELKHQAEILEEEHKIADHHLSVKKKEAHSAIGKLNEQLRIVLGENVALQKQLIKLEQQYLKSMMKSSPITQIKEAQTEVDELRKEIEGLRDKVQEAEKVKELADMLQESHRSLVATNERLLGELKRSGEYC